MNYVSLQNKAIFSEEKFGRTVAETIKTTKFGGIGE
jgi:hypothetical protein